MSNSGTKEPSPQTSTAQSPPEPQRRGRGRPRKQQQVGTSRSEKAMFIWGGGVGPPGTQNGSTPRLSLSPSRSRSDHRLRSGLEDDRKAARTKAPKLHRRLSPKLLFFFFLLYLRIYNVHKSTQNLSGVSEGVCV